MRTLFPRKNNVQLLTKNGLGYIFGDFFTNSSSHPAHNLGKLDKLIFSGGEQTNPFSLNSERLLNNVGRNILLARIAASLIKFGQCLFCVFTVLCTFKHT
jgi:hypothetical protein